MTKVAYITTCQDLIPRWQLEIKALRENGLDVMVICLDRLHSRPARENNNGIEIIRVHPNAKRTQTVDCGKTVANWGVKNETTFKKIKTIAFSYLLFVKLIKQNAIEVVHCCHPSLLPVAWYVKKKYKCKIIYEISEFYIEQIFLRLPKFLRIFEKIAFNIENFFVQHVDGVVCYPSINDILYNRYQKYCQNIKNVSNVPELKSNIDQKLYDILKEKYLRHKIIIYTGSIVIKDGLIDVLSALRSVVNNHPKLKLLLIGGSLDDDSDVILEFAEKNGLSENVEIIPFQPYVKLYTYFLIADIGLAAFNKNYVVRFTKGNSRKVMEYMKGALPIIGPDYGEATLAVKEEHCGIIVPKWNSSEITKAINCFLNNPEATSEMSKRARQAFEREYNWDVEKIKLIKVYNQTIRQNS